MYTWRDIRNIAAELEKNMLGQVKEGVMMHLINGDASLETAKFIAGQGIGVHQAFEQLVEHLKQKDLEEDGYDE